MLRRNTEKYITFSVPNKKENYDDNKIITYKLKLIDSCRFMQSTLSKLADNLIIKIAKNVWKEKN